MRKVDRASILMRLMVNRRDTFAVQLNSGGYLRISRPLTLEDLRRHLSGEITVGVYLLDPETSRTKVLVFDIDPEHVREPEMVAKAIYHEASGRLHPDGVILEASRWPDPSYHIWVCFEPPIPAWAARWIGGKMLEYTGHPKVEIFPKQDRIGPDGFGNLIKLPLGLHRVAGRWSQLLDEKLNPSPEILKEKRPLQVPEEELERIKPRREPIPPPHPRRVDGIRPCMKRALRLQLSGGNGHLMRLAVAVEHLAHGIPEEEVAKLFAKQRNYSYEVSLGHVRYVKQRGYMPFTCSYIQRLGYCLERCPLSMEPMVRVEIAGKPQPISQERKTYKVVPTTIPIKT